MRPVWVLAAALLVIYLHPAAGDTSLLGTLLRSGTDAADCGALGRPCCLRRNNRCNVGYNLECISDGANPRCVPCGGENQVACGSQGQGRQCDKGLTVIDRGMLMCVAQDKPLPPKATATATTIKAGRAVGGGSRGRGGKDEADARREEHVRGRKAGMSACATEDDCLPAGGAPGSRGFRSCVAGVCVPCGGPDQACCVREPQCKQYGPGSVTVSCVDDSERGAKMCKVPETDDTVAE